MSEELKTPNLESPVYEPGLFSEFTPPTYEEWKAAAVASLKGAPFDKKVITKTYEDIDLQPMYWPDDVKNLPHLGSWPGFPPYVRGTRAEGYLVKPWGIAQEIPYPTPEEFNRAARHDLDRGMTVLNMVLDSPTRLGEDADQIRGDDIGVSGLSLSELEDLKIALAGIDLARTPLHIAAGVTALPLVALLVDYLMGADQKPAVLQGCVGADPLAELVRTGRLPIHLDLAYDAMAALAAWAHDQAPGLQTILVHGVPYREAGGNAVQELAFSMATGVEYVRALLDRGLDMPVISAAMRFSLAIGSDFFMEIAKLRAGRLLWSQIVAAFGGNDQAQKMTVHGRTSSWTKTIYDPYVNLLRNTTQAFAGVVSGVDSLHITAYDEALGLPDEFSRRVSRNVHLLLRHEGHFNQPIDPAGGAWYVEYLTDQIARKAWALFQEIEAGGGMFRALEAGIPQARTAENAEKKAAGLSTRQDILVGTNLYANPQEAPPSLVEVDRDGLRRSRAASIQAFRDQFKEGRSDLTGLRDSLAARSVESVRLVARALISGSTLGDVYRHLKAPEADCPRAPTLRIHRAAEPFEALRRNSDRHLAQTGRRPAVFLANMGPIPQHKARADFTTGFFQAGGFEVLTNDGFDAFEDAARAALDSGARIVVICSSDRAYPDLVPPLIRRIKTTRPEILVILAGRPDPESEVSYREAGLDDFIHLRSDCRRMLAEFQEKTGVNHA